jgi:NTE family protein
MAIRPSINAPDPPHLRTVLGRSPLFSVLTEDEREEVAALLSFGFVPGGEVLFQPGDPSDTLYLVVHGRLRIFWDLDGSGRIEPHEAVDDIGEGGIVGDVGMLSDDPHHAMVIAVRDTEVGCLSEEVLWQLAHRHPVLARRLGYHAVQRLQGALRAPLEPERVNVAVVPADEGAPIQAFAAALAQALGALLPLLHVSADRFDQELGSGASQDDVDRWDEMDRRIVRWVCDQERCYRFILYEADPTYTAWTRRCLRIADHVLVVARASGDVALSKAEQQLVARHDVTDLVRTELVLLHEGEDRAPTGTIRWLRERPAVRAVHHVRLERQPTLARLARFLAGRATGLVLGGGGSRCAAQMGAVAALRDVGIPLDAVGGTSAGGGVAAMVAMGWDLQTMRERYHHAFVKMAPFSQWTLPYYSFLRKDRLEAVSRYLFGDVHIEDLETQWFGLTCDLVSGEMVMHRSGELWRAVQATTALPGLMAPVLWDGRLLVDGGMLDNNPVGPMRAQHVGPVMLVDVGQAEARLVDPPHLQKLPSNALALWHRLKPFGSRIRVPTIPEVLLRAMTVRRPNLDLARATDLYVRPPVEAYGLTDFARTDELIAIGYNATMAALEARDGDADFARRLGITRELRELPRLPLVRVLARSRGPRTRAG